jgi:hypothetical protein
MLRRSLNLAVVVVIGLAVSVSAFELGIRGMDWFPDLYGHVQVDNSGRVRTEIDLRDDLGINNESYARVEAFIGIRKHHFAFS